TDGQKSRGDIHILLIGDPGVAKSVTLNFMANISPKGRYVVGKSASGAGLTATVVRDEYLRGWSLEAGAMVLSNKGLVCIDELEKMDPSDRSAMHEAMEQQTVTISKANVQATLRAETSVLAAANPKFGRFDPYQSIAQQIDIPPTLINRFDVIFTLRDIPDRENDQKIATHVLTEHQKEGEAMLIPRELFRKYVAYSKQRIKPKLSDEAVEEIKKFYVDLRNRPIASESALRPIPISARQLQALIRMAEASAKLKLKKQVTVNDSRIAIELMKYYLMQVGYDYESKTFDIDKITLGRTASQRNKVFTVRETINELEGKVGELIPVEEIENELEDKLTKNEIEDALVELEKHSIIFKPRKGYVQRM
ncbi:AAA family ATPase, partial [Candidatus Pacearchaeota archaeon]|nr:AAA family ATPase [Candidatus Pacearchaeota archaeon]